MSLEKTDTPETDTMNTKTLPVPVRAAMAHKDRQAQSVLDMMVTDIEALQGARDKAQNEYLAAALGDDYDERVCKELEYEVLDLQLQTQKKRYALELQRNKKQNTTATTTKTGE